MEIKIDPKRNYSVNEAFKLTPIKGYTTFRRYVDRGFLKATKDDVGVGYTVIGADLIEFLAKLEAGDYKF
jgi:hypothetical protein